MLMIPASAVVGLLPLWLVRRGHYGLALQANRMLFWAVGHNPSMEGWILALAGRYSEARTYLRPLAFDRQIRRGSQARAVPLCDGSFHRRRRRQGGGAFEAAIQTPQANGNSISDLPSSC